MVISRWFFGRSTDLSHYPGPIFAMPVVMIVGLRCVTALLLLSLFGGCATGSADDNNTEILMKRPDGKISKVELQEALLRFESNFGEELREGFMPLDDSKVTRIRRDALNSRIKYQSSALEIALGSVPEANLLDMVAFIELNRDVFKSYWMPKVFGADGKGVADAFDRGRADIWQIASFVLTPAQSQKLRELIRRWQNNHPGQIAVEAVRLTAFALESGAQDVEAQKELGGLLSSVKKATFTADQALLLGERSLEYAQRFPFLVRLHARATVAELVDAASAALSDLPLKGEDLTKAEGALARVQELIRTGTVAMQDGKVVLVELQKLMGLVYSNRNPEMSKLRNEFVSDAVGGLDEYRQILASPVHAQSMAHLNGMVDRFEAASNRLLIKLVLAGVILILFAVCAVLAARVVFRKWAASDRRSRYPRPPRPPRSSGGSSDSQAA